MILLWCVFTCDWHMYMYIDICFRPGNPVLGMKSDQVIVSLVGFHICMYYSYNCFMQFSPFNHTIIPHLYIFTPIFIVSPHSLGLMLFVCSWCHKKTKFILSYLILLQKKLSLWWFTITGLLSLIRWIRWNRIQIHWTHGWQQVLVQWPATLVLWCVPPLTKPVNYASGFIPITILICMAYVWMLVSPELWVSGTCVTMTNTANLWVTRFREL